MIIRQLQHARWSYDEDTAVLGIRVTHPNGKEEVVFLNRTYAFSLARFLIRVFFRMSIKHRKVKVVEDSESPDETLGSSS